MNSKGIEKDSVAAIFLSNSEYLSKVLETRKLKSLKRIGVESKHFSDSEIYVHIEKNAFGKKAIVFKAFENKRINDGLFELFLVLDALNNAYCKEKILVLPYLPYQRQDKQHKEFEAISIRVLANILDTLGANALITFNLHAKQIESAFNFPVFSLDVFEMYFAKVVKKEKLKDACIVFPDQGALKAYYWLVEKNESMIKYFAVVSKQRKKHEKAKSINIEGDVKNKDCIIIDDIIATAGTMTEACKKLREEGAKKIVVFAAHGLFLGNAIEKLKSYADKIYCSNTVASVNEIKDEKINIVDVRNIISEQLAKMLK